jgi:hypothetical protein
MSASPNLHEQPRNRIHPLIASAAAVAVILVSGVGVVALTGILPTSKAIPAAVSALPLVDTQINDSLNGLKPNAQQSVQRSIQQSLTRAPLTESDRSVTHDRHVGLAQPSYAPGQ